MKIWVTLKSDKVEKFSMKNENYEVND